METPSYNKLQLRKARLIRIVIVQTHTVVINKDEVPRTVSIHRVTAAPGPKSSQYAPEPGPARQSGSWQMMSNASRQRNVRTSEYVATKANLQAEYAVKRIVGHRGHGHR